MDSIAVATKYGRCSGPADDERAGHEPHVKTNRAVAVFLVPAHFRFSTFHQRTLTRSIKIDNIKRSTMSMFQETRRDRFGHSSYRIVGAIAILTAVVTIIPWMDRLNVSQPLVKSIGQSHVTSISGEPSGDLPEVAWLMSFPNSGTTYTLQLIQQYTNTTTATNYGNEQGVHGTNTPVHPWMEKGPFCRHLGWNLPPRYILTKTHCGGTAMSPNPADYVETHRSFEIACRSGNRVINDEKNDVTYSMDIPKRAVHLMRNPFDVSYMHF